MKILKEVLFLKYLCCFIIEMELFTPLQTLHYNIQKTRDRREGKLRVNFSAGDNTC